MEAETVLRVTQDANYAMWLDSITGTRCVMMSCIIPEYVHSC